MILLSDDSNRPGIYIYMIHSYVTDLYTLSILMFFRENLDVTNITQKEIF